MIPREFDAITKADIKALVANAVAEGRTIEYKQQLPGDSDDEKREFLADISSFANSSGGDLIYGVTDKRDGNKTTGTPESIVGLEGINGDEQIRRLDEIIRAGIDPRIPGFRIRLIEGFSAGSVLLIRIPKSWTSPHMVVFKKLSRFFSRTSAGKYQLDVREIRSAFTASAELRTKIASFRAERVGKILANDAPVILTSSPKLILHLVPLSFVENITHVDLVPLANEPDLSAPMNGNYFDNRYNLDGLLSFNNRANDTPGYCQIFRSGAIEAVDADLFQASNVVSLIASIIVERTIMESVTKYLKAMKLVGVPLPIIVMVSGSGLKGFGMATRSPLWNMSPRHTIDRDMVLLPEVLVEDYDTKAYQILKPIFDALWQAAGLPGCEHYDEHGFWNGA
jgi:hypothetical protein